jgi:hypothetical protein
MGLNSWSYYPDHVLDSFVHKKVDKPWIGLALDATTRQIIAFHVGDCLHTKEPGGDRVVVPPSTAYRTYRASLARGEGRPLNWAPSADTVAGEYVIFPGNAAKRTAYILLSAPLY